MQIACPYCQHKMSIPQAKPGRYGPKCGKCSQKFSLLVHEDPAQPPTVAAVQKVVLDSPAVEETMPQTAATGAAAATPTRTQIDKGAEVESTGAWTADLPGNEATSATQAGAEVTGAWGATEAARQSDATMAAGGATGTGAVRLGGGGVTAGGGATQATAAGGPVSPGGDEMPSQLGGYQLVKELGRGGMGSVYLARQVSLDRNVALKVMQPKWSKDPIFVARFTREAYAAAQLVHHNVVQIYDIGAERNMNYFSMEFVQGQSLRDLVQKDGKLDVEVAVGYILQAARGLKYAHDQGLIHRDVKPDNLMINDQGIVKVADLGLVKKAGQADLPASSGGQSAAKVLGTAAADITMANVAMGTPAYMSPEQAQSAATVDHRADIYSLGCSLYVLITGRPPFQGTTAMEVITKHQTEPMVPPEMLVKRVPKELSEIILKMTAKRPEDRYQGLEQCIKDLEKFLGVQSSGAFTPKEEHAQLLEECVKKFNASTNARLRPLVAWSFLGVCLLLALVFGLFGIPLLALGFFGMGLMAAVAFTIVNGQAEKPHLYLKLRELVLGAGWGDWLMAAAGGLLVLIVLVIFDINLLWMLAGFAVLAVGLAFAFQFTICRKAVAEQTGPVEEVEKMLRSMRLLGLQEAAIQQFVCKYSGERWEGFFEALFGYEAKLAARAEWGRSERGRARPKHGGWREPVVRWIEGRQRAQKEARERKHLQKIEEQGLRAAGISAEEARRRAEASAGALVENAAELKKEAQSPAGKDSPDARRARIKAMLDASRTNPEAPLSFAERLARGPVGTLLGYRLRFVAGALLVAACAMWMNSNGLIPGQELKQLAEGLGEAQAITPEDLQSTATSEAAQKLAGSWLESYRQAKPWGIPLFSSFNPGVAGLLLVFSAFIPGLRISFLIIPAALILVFGAAFGLGTWIPLAVGAALGGVGLVFVR